MPVNLRIYTICGQFQRANGTSCVSCPENCTFCDSSDVCLECKDNYVLSGGTCQSCPANKFVLPNHTLCIDQKTECGDGSSVLSGVQCETCFGDTPYASPFHNSCVNQSNCPPGSFANSQTANCEICEPNYAKVDHSSCLSSPITCGDGNSVISGYQCQNCHIIDPSRPFTNPNHTDCVLGENCPNET